MQLLSESSWGDPHPLCREGRVSESKACSVRMELLRSGELAEDGVGQQTAIESQRQLTDSLSSFTLESSELVGGRPLQGVRLSLTAVWSNRNYMTTSGVDGFAKIEVVDSVGKPIDIGRISIGRDTPYFGYRSDRLLSNATHVIPAGTYELSTAGLSYPWKHMDKILTLEAGASAIVKYRLPHRMREVMLVVPGTGAIARIQSGEAYGDPLSIGCRHRLWMPEGVTTLSFIYVPKIGEDSVLVHRDIKVVPAEGMQHISVLLD